MNKKTPIVSIIMATYNRSHLISETMDSILNQSYQNWECIIIDDGSTGATQEVLQPYLEKDYRFSYHIRNSNHKKGLPGCRNQGLELVKGDYIIFFDDDDIVHPENLQVCLDLLGDKKSFFCRYDKKPFLRESKMIKFEKIQKPKVVPFNLMDIYKLITGEIPFASCCVLWDIICFEEERFNEELMYAEEWECYSRIISKGFKGISTDTVLYFNRKHPNSNTGEFWNNDPIRRESKIKAVKLVIDNLAVKRLLSQSLVHYFIQTGFFLKEFSIIDHTLISSKGNFLTKLKYKLGYRIYPLIKPVFKLKGRLKKKS